MPLENNLKIFTEVFNHFDQIKINDQSYFLASSSLRKLRYTNIYRKMEELKIITIGRKKYISEKDLIFLILRARDTTVEKFQNWMIECILTNHEKTSEEFDEKNFYLYLDRV